MNETYFLFGVWGWLWVNVLTGPGEIFAPIKSRIYFWLTSPGELSGWRETFYKILLGCGKCHAGQTAFWFGIWSHDISLPGIIISIATAKILEKWS